MYIVLIYSFANPVLKCPVFEKRHANAKKGYIGLPHGEIPPPSALVGRRVIGAMPETKRRSSGLGEGILGRLFRRIERGGTSCG